MNIRGALHKPMSYLAAGVLLFAGIRVFAAMAADGAVTPERVIGGALVTLLDLFLVLGARWAQRATAWLILITCCLLPVAVFNPFTAGDYLTAGKQVPAFSGSLAWLIPLEIFLLFAAYILDPPKGGKSV